MDPIFVSPKPEVKEAENVKFYQKPVFKVAIGLAVATVFLFVGVGVAVNGTSKASIVPGSIQASVPQGQLSDKPKTMTKSIRAPIQVAIPAILKGTLLESAFVSLGQLLSRHWKIMIGALIGFVVLSVALGVGLAIYFEQQRVANELRLAEELQEQQKLDEEASILPEEFKFSWNTVLIFVVSMYGVSLFFTIVALGCIFCQ